MVQFNLKKSLLFSFLFFEMSFSASLNVSGKVLDPAGSPLSGCTVSHGANKVSSESNGNFVLSSSTTRVLEKNFQDHQLSIESNRLKFQLFEGSNVVLSFLDLKGQEVFHTSLHHQTAGLKEIPLVNLIQGKVKNSLYTLRVQIGSQNQFFRILLSGQDIHLLNSKEVNSISLAKTSAVAESITIHCPSSLPKKFEVTAETSNLGNITIKKANILLLYADDMNSWTGLTNKWAKTPNLDKLAGSSMYFNNAHVIAQECAPSRAATLTGKRPPSTGIYWNRHNFRDPRHSSDPEVSKSITLPQYFKNLGYETKSYGKIFHQPAGYFSDSVSFTTQTPNSGTATPTIYKTNPWHNNDFGGYNNEAFLFGPLDIQQKEVDSPDYLNSLGAATHISKPTTKPWFVAYGSFRPHTPLIAPQKYFDMYKKEDIVTPDTFPGDLDDVPPIGKEVALNWGGRYHDVVLKYNAWKDALHAYKACVSFMDNNVGRVLDALDASPEKDNTIVIFISDHAVHLGEKEHWWKMTLWLQTTHIPFLMRVPGISKEGARTNAPVDMTALYPTVLSVLNLPSTGLKLDGEPLTPLLENPNTPWNKAAVTTSGFKNHSVVTDNWRYIQYSDGGEELYNKKTDSLEFKNLIWTPSGKTQYASTVNQLKAFLPKVNLADVCKIGGWDCPAPPEE